MTMEDQSIGIPWVPMVPARKFRSQPGPYRGIRRATDHVRRVALLGPSGEKGMEEARPCKIGVGVQGHVETAAARRSSTMDSSSPARPWFTS